jgi:hypothetical protein
MPHYINTVKTKLALFNPPYLTISELGFINFRFASLTTQYAYQNRTNTHLFIVSVI